MADTLRVVSPMFAHKKLNIKSPDLEKLQLLLFNKQLSDFLWFHKYIL